VQREFSSKMRLLRVDKKTIIIFTEPNETNRVIRTRSFVEECKRASETTAVRLYKEGRKKTKVEFITKLELGEGVSKGTVKGRVERHLAVVIDAAFYFDNLLGSEEATGEDGRAFGEQVMLKTKTKDLGSRKQEVVKSFIQENKAFRELVEKQKFMEGVLCAVVWNRLRRDKAKEGTAFSEEEEEGREMGSKLAMAMATTLTAKHAVDEWSKQFPIVLQTMEEHVWLKPMLETMAARLLLKSKFGVRARVIFGAVTSMLDLVTDIYVTANFYGVAGKEGYFQASLASLTVSMGIQLILIWVQNKGIGWKKVMKESIPVLIGFKPALDAYRVATGVEQERGQTVDAMIEMTMMKAAEMFAEAIPGVIIQLMAIVTSTEEINVLPWLSVAVSAFTTGFVSATLSYDWDTSPEKRRAAPDFYGFIPAAAVKRVTVFASMLVTSAGMLVIRCMSIVLMGLIGRNWALGYVGVDLGLYLIIKLLRGDFWYWIPVGGYVEIILSSSARILTKILSDFTSLVQLRHPQEMGGVSWSFSLVVAIVSLPVAVKINENMVNDKVAISLAWKVIWILIPTVLLSLVIFFNIIESKYFGTFISRQTGKEFAQELFKNGKDNAAKANIFWNTGKYWVGIEDDMKLWVQENWRRWEAEKPEWLTHHIKAQIPVEWIPDEADRQKESVRRKSLRRPSVIESMMGMGDVTRVSPEESDEGGVRSGTGSEK